MADWGVPSASGASQWESNDVSQWDGPATAVEGWGVADGAGASGFDTNGGAIAVDGWGVADGAGASGFDTNGDAFGGGDDGQGSHLRGACFNCGQDGHNKADCPNPRVMKCRHCNEEGHMQRDCPTAPPQEFTGECRICMKEGHRAKDCPDKPPTVCKNCQQEGHMAADCTNARNIDRSIASGADFEKVWELMKQAVLEGDLDDVKEHIHMYCTGNPDLTYVDIEDSLRRLDIGLWLIALEKPNMLKTKTNMDLQGNLGKKYTVNFRFSNLPARPREREIWPENAEDNLERLKDAGVMVDTNIPICSNCDEKGHTAKNCPQEKVERERVSIMCYNCGEGGHRVRDCPQPRIDKFACKNCHQSGHKAADCPEPRVAGDDVECRKCGETGHFSRDCPQGGGGGRGCFNCGSEDHRASDCPEPKKVMCRNCDQEGHRSNECPEPKNMSKVQCRNCDEFGHESRGCPKPRDYSRVTCQNCGEKGHTKVRCQQATANLDTVDANAGYTFGGDGEQGASDWNQPSGANGTAATGSCGDDWNTGTGAAAASASEWNTGSAGGAEGSFW